MHTGWNEEATAQKFRQQKKTYEKVTVEPEKFSLTKTLKKI